MPGNPQNFDRDLEYTDLGALLPSPWVQDAALSNVFTVQDVVGPAASRYRRLSWLPTDAAPRTAVGVLFPPSDTPATEWRVWRFIGHVSIAFATVDVRWVVGTPDAAPANGSATLTLRSLCGVADTVDTTVPLRTSSIDGFQHGLVFGVELVWAEAETLDLSPDVHVSISVQDLGLQPPRLVSEVR